MSDHKKSKVRFSSKIVVASVSAVLFYTIFIFCLELLNIKYGTNIQVPVDLTAAWYAFWTVELVCLASIRKTKIKNKYEYDDPDREKSMSEILEGLRRIGEGTEVVTPSTNQVPAEIFVGQNPTQSQQMPTSNQTVVGTPTAVVSTAYTTTSVDPMQISTNAPETITQSVPVQTVSSTSVTGDEADFVPMTEYYSPKIASTTNDELDSSLPKIDDSVGYNNAFPNDKYITGG